MTVEWKDGKPITNPVMENGCIVFRTTEEEQKAIQKYNWHCVDLILAQLIKAREKR